eukprot:scaffold437684_cov40-Prasinocladus_malaysianus.AAC.1
MKWLINGRPVWLRSSRQPTCWGCLRTWWSRPTGPGSAGSMLGATLQWAATSETPAAARARL